MIILLGGSGYIGNGYQAFFKANGIAFRNLKRAEVDYSDTGTLLALLRAEKPDFLINAAGFTGKPNVDACEPQKAETLFGNAVLPGRIAEACQEAGIPWGHVSSGCIYSGDGPKGQGDSGFTEKDTPNFSFRSGYCSFYSGTKALGEEVLESYDNVYIWRLRIPFDHNNSPRNYLTKLMRYDTLLEARNSISDLGEFVAASFACYEKGVPFGKYNMTNPGSITTSEVTQLIKDSGVCDKDFKFFDSEDDFMQKAAKTPRSNCVMNTNKLSSVGIEMTPVREAICNALANWNSSTTLASK